MISSVFSSIKVIVLDEPLQTHVPVRLNNTVGRTRRDFLMYVQPLCIFRGVAERPRATEGEWQVPWLTHPSFWGALAPDPPTPHVSLSCLSLLVSRRAPEVLPVDPQPRLPEWKCPSTFLSCNPQHSLPILGRSRLPSLPGQLPCIWSLHRPQPHQQGGSQRSPGTPRTHIPACAHHLVLTCFPRAELTGLLDSAELTQICRMTLADRA